MPFFITVAGAIRQCFPDFATARSIVLELRDQGQKPRLYYSTSFEHLGWEIDDHSTLIQDYTDMGWCDFAKLLSQVDSSWSVTDDDLSNDRDRLVDVYALLSGRNHHLAEWPTPEAKSSPRNSGSTHEFSGSHRASWTPMTSNTTNFS